MEKIILQFVRGEIDFGAFYREYCRDEAIIRCLEDTVTELGKRGIPVTYDAVFRADMDAEGDVQRNGESHAEIVVPSKHFPTVRSRIDFFMNSDCSLVMKRAEIYDLVFSIVAALEPETAYYRKYSEDFRFFLRAVPEYAAGGEAACDYIEREIVAKIPRGLSEAKRVRLCREMIRQNFHIEGNKYPRWVQSAEWPMSGGMPARYLGFEREGDLVRYHFEDVLTGERIAVEQIA